jgi:hypothetical protein
VYLIINFIEKDHAKSFLQRKFCRVAWLLKKVVFRKHVSSTPCFKYELIGFMMILETSISVIRLK